MTPTGKNCTWMLWSPAGSLPGGSDEFIVEGFRVRLMGNRLEMSFEASGTCSPDSARALAEKYVEALGKRLVMTLALMTEAEWLRRTTPPFGGNTTVSFNREDRSRVARAVREARNELLAAADEALRRCYDYLQDAHERMNTLNDEAAYAAYKAIEVLEGRFGGELKAVAALGKTLKDAKTAANKERHIPEKVQLQPKVSGGSVELTTQVIRSYERYVLEEAHKKKEG